MNIIEKDIDRIVAAWASGDTGTLEAVMLKSLESIEGTLTKTVTFQSLAGSVWHNECFVRNL